MMQDSGMREMDEGPRFNNYKEMIQFYHLGDEEEPEKLWFFL